MKKYLLVAIVSLLITPAVAFSQMGPGGPQGGGERRGERMNQNRPNNGSGEDSTQFQARKAEILKRISERMTELQKRQSCVQAANDRQALRACMPQGEGQGYGPPKKRQGSQGNGEGQGYSR